MTTASSTPTLSELGDLVRRMELEPQLLRRMIEEEIALLVPIADVELREAERQLVGEPGRDAWVEAKGWPLKKEVEGLPGSSGSVTAQQKQSRNARLKMQSPTWDAQINLPLLLK